MLGHKHYWEYRGKKKFVKGIWISEYWCQCGETLKRGRK